MKKALSVVLSIAIILSLFAVIGTFTVSAAGTVFEVANFGAIKLSNMLYDGFQRQSRLFPEDATYVQTVTGLRQTRGWEKENASLLEVTVPDKGNNNLKVGTDVMSKYFLTLPNKRATHPDCTDPDTLTDTGSKLPLIDGKYTVVYIEYFIESLPDVSGAWNETEINFYIDGEPYKTISIDSFGANYNGIFDQYYGIILGDTVYTPNNSTGATNYTLDYPTPKYEIDYVRLYQKSGESRKINGVLVVQ